MNPWKETAAVVNIEPCVWTTCSSMPVAVKVGHVRSLAASVAIGRETSDGFECCSRGFNGPECRQMAKFFNQLADQLER